MEFYHQFPDKPQKGSFQHFRKPSLTEPDNTMSIPEIIARYTRGQGAGVQLRPWQIGTSPEEGEGPQHDASLEQVLEMEAPADTKPAAVPAAPAAPAAESAAASAAAPTAAPAPAPAGA